MKIVHVNMSCASGGASIAASRHAEAMRRCEADARMLTLDDLLEGRGFRRTVYRVLRWLRFKMNGLYGVFGSFGFMRSGFSIERHPDIESADIVYLHWVDDGLLSMRSLERLLATGKPVYWFMHDMFPFTGGCHYSMECSRYRDICRNCPLVKRRWLLDIVKRCFERKGRIYSMYPNLAFLAPSHWLAECAASSALCEGHAVSVCPNLIDTGLFLPGDKSSARASFFEGGEDRKVILFSAEAIDNPYKGWPYLLECLSELDPSRYVCLVLGKSHHAVEFKDSPVMMVFTGYLSAPEDIIRAYRASDVFVTPSLADNFPNVLLEALSCGLPCVGFDSGGVSDLVLHMRTGYLARRCDAKDLAGGIEWVLADDARYLALCSESRNHAVGSYSYERVKDYHKCLEP